jgi:predicted nucleotidyltransferase
MVSRINKAAYKNLITPPKWLPHNTAYEVITGSFSYGVSSDTSDMDIVGFCLPPKHIVFPHLAGHIPGFGTSPEKFEVYQQHHVHDPSERREYDFTIYSIVKYFDLCMDMNPNMVDSLFVPRNCIQHSTAVGEHVRDNRKKFLHKGAYQRFRGYAYSQLSKIDSKKNASNPKRHADIEKFGYDLKFAYHVVRLALEAQQIIEEGDLDLQANIEILKSIRKGEWTLDEIHKWFKDKETTLEKAYNGSLLQFKANEEELKMILIECLEMHYGSLTEAVNVQKNYDKLGLEVRELLSKYSI